MRRDDAANADPGTLVIHSSTTLLMPPNMLRGVDGMIVLLKKGFGVKIAWELSCSP